MNEELDAILEILLEDIVDRFKREKNPSYKIWFNGFSLVSLSEDKAVFTTPSNTRHKFLTTKYLPMIKEALINAVGGEDIEIEIISTENHDAFEDSSIYKVAAPTEEERVEAEKREREINKVISRDNKEDGDNIISKYTFENFIEGESNKFARAACLAVAMEPATIYNPLFIYGNSGVGKTHLLCAVINHIKKNHPRMKIIYKKSEDFTNELISAIQRGDTASFKNFYRKCDILLLDDIQFIANKEQTQEEFFHTFSSLYEAGKQIILTSDRPPKDIRPLEDRLRTRFEGGLLADVQKPSFELRTAIIKKKASEHRMNVSNELVNYMAERLQHDIRQIEGVIKRLSAYSSIHGFEITKESIDSIISQIDPGNIPTEALIEKILMCVAKNYDVSVEDIKSKKKYEAVANARHIALYIIRNLTELPLKKIGEIVGRDHSTVMSSIEKVKINIKTKKKYESEINRVIAEIKANC